MRTFSGNFTNKDLRDDPNDKPFRRGISALQRKSRNDAQQQVANLQKQFQDTGNRPDMAQLNQLEELGAKTFGTGMRGIFDYTGSAQQPISRSQVGQFRNTFNDPSLQVFDRKTGVNPIGLGIGDYANYYQGREDRLAKTPLGGIMNTISDFGDKAMQYSPLNYIIPQSFRGTPPNRQIPSALQEELEGTKLPPNVSFTPPSGLASIKIPSLGDLFSSLNFGAEKNKNQNQDQQDLTMDQLITTKGISDNPIYNQLITAKGMSQGGYGGEDRKPKNLGIKTSLSPAGDEFDITALLGESSDNLSKLGAELVDQGLIQFSPMYSKVDPETGAQMNLGGTKGFFAQFGLKDMFEHHPDYEKLFNKYTGGEIKDFSEEQLNKPFATAFLDANTGYHYIIAEKGEDGEYPTGTIMPEEQKKYFSKPYDKPIQLVKSDDSKPAGSVNHELRHAAINYLDKKYPGLFLQYKTDLEDAPEGTVEELAGKAFLDEEAQMHYHDKIAYYDRLGIPYEARSEKEYHPKYERKLLYEPNYQKAFDTLNSLANQEILNLTRPKKEAYSEDDYETMDTSAYSPVKKVEETQESEYSDSILAPLYKLLGFHEGGYVGQQPSGILDAAPVTMTETVQPSEPLLDNSVEQTISSQANYVMPALGAPVNNRLPQFNYGKEQAEMRMTQRDIKSPEEQAYINKVLGYEAAPIKTDMNPIFKSELPKEPTDLMAGFRSSEFALPKGAITDMAMGSVGLEDGRDFRFGSMAEAGAFRNYLDSIGQSYKPINSLSRFTY